MALLAIQRPGARLGVASEAFTVSHESILLARRPVHEVDELHIYGAVSVSPAARDTLLRRGVDTLFLTEHGQYRGRLATDDGRHGARRASQFRRLLLDDAFALSLARACVEAKLHNQRSLLDQIARNHPDRCPYPIRFALARAARRASAIDSIERLRGVEGHGAALYFRGYAAAFSDPVLRFRRRSRRPPRDPVNACLSFGYTLLLRKVESAIRRAGLDPALGALHEPGVDKPALALDLMEAFRPMIDRVVLSLFNRRQLGVDDFEHPALDDGRLTDAEANSDAEIDAREPVYLARRGREVFLRALGQLWRRRVPHGPEGRRFELAAVLDLEARRLSGWIEGGEPWLAWRSG